ncbi:hypothetical protein G6F60_013532 [Rhizopus arrhizus]|nr:hypothetical protein G6F60_013532 [Rhizopus arrhizus]
MLALHEHRQLAVAAQPDRHADLADQRIARHHRAVDVEGIATHREAVAAGHVGVTGGVLPPPADGQLCRETLAAAHVPAAPHAHRADIERVLAAFQHQRSAAALLRRTSAVDPVLGELHVRLQLGPAVGPGPAALHLGDGHIRILAAVQGLAQHRHLTGGARAVLTARHAAAHREAVVPLALRVSSRSLPAAAPSTTCSPSCQSPPAITALRLERISSPLPSPSCLNTLPLPASHAEARSPRTVGNSLPRRWRMPSSR